MIKWSDRFSVANPSIDDQHKLFIQNINEFDAAAKGGATREHLEEMLQFLKEYAKYHFVEEEKLMRAAKYPDLAIHAQIHDNFVSRIMELTVRLNADGDLQALVAEISEFMHNWMLGHIKKVDHAFAVFIATGKRLPIVVR